MGQSPGEAIHCGERDPRGCEGREIVLGNDCGGKQAAMELRVDLLSQTYRELICICISHMPT